MALACRFSRVISYSLLGLAAVGLAATFSFSIHYGNVNPVRPEVNSGHIYAYNYHVRVVYLSSEELIKLRIAQGLLVIGGVGFLLVIAVADPYNFRKRRVGPTR